MCVLPDRAERLVNRSKVQRAKRFKIHLAARDGADQLDRSTIELPGGGQRLRAAVAAVRQQLLRPLSLSLPQRPRKAFLAAPLEVRHMAIQTEGLQMVRHLCKQRTVLPQPLGVPHLVAPHFPRFIHPQSKPVRPAPLPVLFYRRKI
jgi:hypothetical protein